MTRLVVICLACAAARAATRPAAGPLPAATAPVRQAPAAGPVFVDGQAQIVPAF